MTQAQLAEALARTVEAISNIERGRSLPPTDLLQRAAEVLEVDIAQLIETSVVGGSIGERAALDAKLRSISRQLPIAYLRVVVQQATAIAELGFVDKGQPEQC